MTDKRTQIHSAQAVGLAEPDAAPRPVTARLPRADRRLRLLDAALDVFSQKGYEGATTREIAHAAGVTEAVLFSHFANKVELYTSLLDIPRQKPELQRWQGDVLACMERNDDEGLFRLIAQSSIKIHDIRFQRVLIFAALEGHRLAVAHLGKSMAPFFQKMTDYIARRQRAGAIRKMPPGIPLHAIMAMAKHYAMMTRVIKAYPREHSDDEVVDLLLDVLLHGIVPAKDCACGPGRGKRRSAV